MAQVTATAGLLAGHAVPALTTIPAVRERLAPTLAGVGDSGHVALTFDDGPHPVATPRFAALLADHGIRATFFVLGENVIRHPGIVQDLAEAGHEIAIHGFDHRCLLARGPRATYDKLALAFDLTTVVTGRAPTWFRPPYGVLTSGALAAARRLRLTPVLWTCWGRDWTARATPQSVIATVTKRLTGGGTVLLHDSDCTSTPGSWRTTLAALPAVIEHCQRRELRLGPLGEHFSSRHPVPQRSG